MSHRLLVTLTIGLSATVVVASTPAAAHELTDTVGGLVFPVIVVTSMCASLLGGGAVLATADLPGPSAGLARLVPALSLGLGGVLIALALGRAPVSVIIGAFAGVGIVTQARGRGRALTDCGACADAAIGAVTLHRVLEGAGLATLYAADAALGLIGAGLLTVHAVAETVLVGSLYAATRRHVLGAVCLLQAGFGVGIVVGWAIIGAVPAIVEAGLFGLGGGVLVAVGIKGGYNWWTGRRSVTG